MREAIKNALISAEQRSLRMREDLEAALREMWEPIIVPSIVRAPAEERDRVLTEIIWQVTADILAEYGEAIEEECEEAVNEIVLMMRGAGSA